ncbi:hypothetical protein IEQ34_003801 [Dendrobium chrysotoxum]|uniref:Uncharacterized protein n=1 Tax=Dendrobium chrysotoxum TaxID=161865 RepID=A0AAV7HGG0_DENCH|nr:hypothetical protein IEQ34_003801 [Dendrobium chrysotoxum]
MLEDGVKNIENKLAPPPFHLQQLLLLPNKAKNLSSIMERSPSTSMLTAILPAMKALIAKDLLGHSEMDVKVCIASCLCEITRITTADAPYDDDIMKEIFGLIVGAFKDLDEMSICLFPKRVSILEIVAKYFLKTIRAKHYDIVFSSVETIMTLILEETESIYAQFLLCLLDGVKVVEKNILHTAKKLAEKVLVNCSLKLKPYLARLFNDNGALLSDYNKIVAVVFQWKFDTSIQNEINASGEVFHPEKYVAAANGSSKPVTNNRCFQDGNGYSMAAKKKVEFSHHSGKSRVNTEHRLDSGTTKPNKRSNLSSRKGGRNTSLQLSISNDHYGVGNKKKARNNSNRKLPANRDRNGSQRKVRVRFLENKPIAGTTKQKGVKHVEVEDKELKLKEVLSSQKSTVKDLVKDHNHVKDTGKTKSRWKRAQGVQEASGPQKRRKDLDDTIKWRWTCWSYSYTITMRSTMWILYDDKDLAKLLTGYQDMVGLLHVHKVAQISSQVPVILEASTFSLKLQRRRSLVLERLNQAPVEGSSGTSYGTAGPCSGSLKGSSIDF